jgi:coproporphyrinogen III oxidase-like Fe-S oxidoreductase
MRTKKSHLVADQFSDDEIDQIKRYGQALSGGVTPFDEEVERHLARYEASRKNMEAAKAAQSAQNAPPPPRALR